MRDVQPSENTFHKARVPAQPPAVDRSPMYLICLGNDFWICPWVDGTLVAHRIHSKRGSSVEYFPKVVPDIAPCCGTRTSPKTSTSTNLLLCDTHESAWGEASHLIYRFESMSENGMRAQIDLMRAYGATELTFHQVFPTGSAATHFIQDYCFNANKKLSQEGKWPLQHLCLLLPGVPLGGPCDAL